MVKMRSSGIELLRIIAMLMIIVVHIYNFGGLTHRANELGGSFDAGMDFIWIFTRCCVNVYIMITGYFLVDSRFDLKKTAKRVFTTYGMMVFYSVCLTAASLILFPDKIPEDKSMAEIILRGLFPFTSRTWYFLTLFLVLSALAPFINIVLQKLEKKQYLILLGVMFFITSIFPLLEKVPVARIWVNIDDIIDANEGKSLYSFIFMYCLGGYLKRFVKKPQKINIRFLLAYIGICSINFIIKLFSGADSAYSGAFGWFSNPFVIFSSIAIFMFFLSLNFYSNIVNKIASTTFAVYMIHEFTYLRNFLWSVFSFKQYDGSVFQCVIKIIGISLLVFAVCMTIELLRQLVFNAVSRLFGKNKSDAKV